MGARVGWWALVAVWIFLACALLSYSPADPPGHAVFPPASPAQNWCGFVGAWLAHYAFALFGWGAWVLLIGAGVGVFVTPFRNPFDHVALRAVGLVLLAISVAGVQALLLPGSGSRPEGGGGLVAIAAVAELAARFGALGTLLWLMLGALVGATLAFDKWVLALPGAALAWALPGVSAAGSKLRESWAARSRTKGKARATKVRANDVDDDRPVADERSARARAGGAKPKVVVVEDEEDDEELDEVEPEAETRSARGARAKAAAIEEDEDDEVEEPQDAADDDEEEDDAEAGDAPGAPQVFDPEALREKIARLPVRFAGVTKQVATDADMADLQAQASLEGYRFPGLDLLEDPEHNYSEKIESYVREQARALEEALRVYKIDGEVVSIDSGPVITLYEVKLAPGTKVAQLSAIASDLARALKAVNIRIVPNTAGRDTVGVEVPNLEKEKVRLKELLRYHEPTGEEGAPERKSLKHKLPMFFGKDAQGEPLIEDLASMPHMLIAGTTGSGKSVCINTIIMSFLYTKRPDELKLVLIDPKMVEMSQFRDIPHLMCPVVTEMSRACAILEWAVTKMDERYELLAEAGVRDITTYNDMPWEELRERFNPQNEQEEARIPRKLPYIVFIIDELADLMMTQKEVEGAIVRIAQKARAVGIHLVLATQRPQANVVTGLIKSNMPGRICFKVASGMDSRIVMDQKGGELLLGQGDMLFLSPRSHKLMRSQGTLVEDKEIRRVVRFLREIAAPSFERKLMQLRPGDEEGAEERGLENAQKDPLFDKAVEIVLETKRGSVSLLQRRLAIGYSRSSRLIDLMGAAGIISDHKGTVARDVMITPEEWNAMKAQAEADREAAEAAGRAPARQTGLFDESAPQAEAKPASDEDAPFQTEDLENAIDDATESEDDELEDEDDAEAVGEDDEEAVDEEDEELEEDDAEDEEDAEVVDEDEEEEEEEEEEDEEELEEEEAEEEDEDAEYEDEADDEAEGEEVETRPVGQRRPAG